MAEAPPYYLARPGAESQPPPQNPIVVDGVTYMPVAGMPGVYVSPWGQYGYFEETPGTFPDSPKTKSFKPIADKYVTGDDPSGGSRLASDDPRYWELQYAELDQREREMLADMETRYAGMGLDAESARRNALANLIQNRNTTAADLYATGVQAAKIGAEFAANPRDAMADLYYRNAVGGATPYGDMSGPAGSKLQTDLFNRFNEIFGGIAGDRAKAWEFVSAIPPSEYLQPAATGPAASVINPNTTLPAVAPTAPGGPQLTAEAANAYANFDRMQAAVNSGQGEAFKKWVTATAPKAPGAAMGGVFNFDPGVAPEKPGFTPTSTEGGLNININEPAVVMGVDSGRIYAKIAEPRPDGTRRAEQLIVKPLKSEVEKDKKLQEMGKQAISGGMSSTPGMANGGSVTSIPKPWDFLDELRKNLAGIGGTGGGAGGAVDPNTGVAPLRLYAGAPEANMSPTQRQYLYAAQSAAGVSPEEVDWTLKRFTPNAPINNLPRISF